MEELTNTKVDWKKIAVVGFLVLLTGLVSAGATWYVGDMFHQNELDVRDEEISTLETRVEQLQAQIAPTTPTPVAEKAKPYQVKELGIEFTLDKSIEDLYYAVSTKDTVWFSTRSLANNGKYCAASSMPLGGVTVTTQAPLTGDQPGYLPGRAVENLVKKSGNKYIYYVHTQSTCSGDKTVSTSQSAQSDALRESLESANLIK